MSPEPDKPPSLDDLLKESDAMLRGIGGSEAAKPPRKEDPLEQRRRQALAAARELETKAVPAISPAQRALNAARELEARKEAARKEEAEKAALAAETARVEALLRESENAAPKPLRPQSPVTPQMEMHRELTRRGVDDVPPRGPQVIDDAQRVREDIQKAVANPAVVKLLLFFFLGPPALFFLVFVVVLIVQAANGNLKFSGASNRGSGAGDSDLGSKPRKSVKPAFDFTREQAEARILQGHKVVGKNEFGYPLLQISDREVDVHTYYFSLYNTRTNTIEALPEDFFRMGLMLEFSCFEKPGSPPMYSLAVAAFQTAAIYGHEEALSRFWALFDKGHDPQRVFKPRETARTYMHNRDAKWRDPTE